MSDLAAARNFDAASVRDNLFVDQRSVAPPWEDPVTYAINAAMGLLDDEDRAKIELVIVGTETAVDFEKAQHRRTEMWQRLARFFERYDVLVTPTTAVPAFPIGTFFPEEIAGRKLENQLDWFPFTYPFNITGSPAISVPCGWTAEGLPVGLQIVGRRFAEATVLRVAAAYETAAPWIERRPAL